LISLGIYDEAAARCADALVHAQEMKDRQNIAQSYNTLGIVLYHQGAYDRALEAYAQALQIYQSLGSAYQEANTLMHVALALSAQGRFEEGREAAQKTVERAEALHTQRLKVEALNALAEVALEQGEAATATTYAQAATSLSDEIGSKYDGGIARRLVGQAAAMRGAPFAAEFEASIALFEAIKNRFELARTWAAYGTALLKNGNEIAARAYLKQALDTFVTIGAHGEQQRLAPIVERSV
jgi:tetratricopeptide (TPR) repeat protein